MAKFINKTEVGAFGEKTAEEYLLKLNYKILARNFRKPWGEIDIVAHDKNTKEIIFVEVKSRIKINENDINPEEEITSQKIKKLKKIFLSYLNLYPPLFEETPWRFDVIAIMFNENLSDYKIHHYRDQFLHF